MKLHNACLVNQVHRENCFTNCEEKQKKLFRCKFGRSRVCLTNGRHEAALLIQSVHHPLGIMCCSTDLYFYNNFLPHLFPCLLIDFDLCLSWLCLCLWSIIIDHAINYINFLYLFLWWCNQFGFYSYPLIFLYSCSYFSRHLLVNIKLRWEANMKTKKGWKLCSKRYQLKYPL